MANIPQRVPLVDLKTGMITREWLGPITEVFAASATDNDPVDLTAINERLDALTAEINAQAAIIAELQLGYQA